MYLIKGDTIVFVPEEFRESAIKSVESGGCDEVMCSNCVLGPVNGQYRCYTFGTSCNFKGVSIYGGISTHKLGKFYE